MNIVTKSGSMQIDANHAVTYEQVTTIIKKNLTWTNTEIVCSCGATESVKNKFYKWQAINHTTANPLSIR